MKEQRLLIGMLTLLTMAGCRAAARIVQEPRPDFEVTEGGNRGYLVGTPPPVRQDRKPMRQVIEAEFEVPTRHRPSGRRSAVMVGQVEREPGVADEAWQPEGASASYESYTVKAGDTLTSIAAKPEIYGSAGQWQRLYNANRERIQDPNRITAGMTLRVPRDEGVASGQAEQEEDEQPIQFIK
jgi:nucleoid-associated protein YgaU